VNALAFGSIDDMPEAFDAHADTVASPATSMARRRIDVDFIVPSL
jgi:hypothetical protein